MSPTSSHATQTSEPEDAIRAIGPPAESMLLGMWTTAATFLGLVVIDFPEAWSKNSGLLLGASMVLVRTLLLVPAALERRPSRRSVRSLQMLGAARTIRHHRWPIIAASDPRHDGAWIFQYRAARQPHARPTAFCDSRGALPAGGDRDVRDYRRTCSRILQQGTALEPLLEVNTRLTSALAAELPGTAIEAPTTCFPPTAFRASAPH